MTGTFAIPKRIDQLQAFRCLLALGVFLSHFEALAATGIGFSMPVYVFYALSGFLVMLSTRNPEKKKGFLPRRFIRLVPLYWILSVFTFAASQIAPDIIGYKASFSQLIKSMLCLPYVRDSVTTGADRLRPLVGPAHTLEVEVLFTLLFFVCMTISHKHRGKISFAVCMALFALGEAMKYTHTAFRTAFCEFYFRHSRAAWLYFALGILAFWVTERIEKSGIGIEKLRLPAGFTAAASMFAAALLIASSGRINTDVWLSLQALLGAAIIVLLVLISSMDIKTPKFLVRLGDASFSFFLLHFYIVKITEKLLDAYSLGARLLIAVPVALALSAAAALVSHLLIEEKLTGLLLRKK